MGMYSPGNDYVVVTPAADQPSIDLDVVSTATRTTQATGSTTASTPPRSPTVSRTTPRRTHTTRAPPTTSLSVPHRSTLHWGDSTLHLPSSTHGSQRTARVSHTSPRSPWAHSGTREPPRGTPHTLTKRPALPRTPALPHPTLRIAKPPRTGISSPPSRQLPPRPKGPVPSPKGQEHRPGSPAVTFTSDYGNLNTREPISREISWEVGNWSEVGGA